MKVLVRGLLKLDVLWQTLVVLAAIAIAVTGVMAVAGGGAEPVILAASIVVGLILAATLRYVQVIGRRVWIEDLEDGEFRISTSSKKEELTDAAVLSVTTEVKALYSNGAATRGQRFALLELDSDKFPKAVDCKYTWPIAKSDPLQDLFNRWYKRIVDVAEEELRTTGLLVGRGWNLTPDEIQYSPPNKPKGEEAVARRDITAAEVVDRRVCLWTANDETPFLRIPIGTPNVIALMELLTKQLKDKPAADANAPGLGRMIFQRDKSWPVFGQLCAYILGLLFSGGGVALIVFTAINAIPDKGIYFAGAGLGALGVGIIALAVVNRSKILQCYERGLRQNTNGRVRELRYDEIRTYTYSAVRGFYNGAYTGTTVGMQLEPHDGPVLKYNSTFKNEDGELDSLRDAISLVMAKTMKAKLDAGKPVRWTNDIDFESDGLDIHGGTGKFAKIKEQFIEWDDIDSLQMDGGVFYLFAFGEKKPLHTMSVTKPNFFPGFQLLLQLKYPPPPIDPDATAGDPRR